MTPSGRLLVRIEAVQIPVVDRTRKVYLRECHTASESFGFSGLSIVAPDPWWRSPTAQERPMSAMSIDGSNCTRRDTEVVADMHEEPSVSAP